MSSFLVDFCTKKKIDFVKLQSFEPEIFCKWNKMLEVMSEESFSVQELFIINQIRRKYPLERVVNENPQNKSEGAQTNIENEPPVKPKAKPVFKPKM